MKKENLVQAPCDEETVLICSTVHHQPRNKKKLLGRRETQHMTKTALTKVEQ